MKFPEQRSIFGWKRASVQERLASRCNQHERLSRPNRFRIHPPEPRPLDFDYIPEAMVGRESIQQTLAGKFHSIAHPNGSANVVITGPVGSGKTLLARTFCRDIEHHLRNKRPLRSVHINCRNATTNVRVAHVLFSLSTLDTQTVGFQWVNC